VTPPERHILGPVKLETSIGPIEYSVELTVGEVDTDTTHAVVILMAVLRGQTAVASIHHLDQITLKDIDTEVEEIPDE
jgi:hypothetical protein